MLGYGFAYTATNSPCQSTKRPGTFALGERLKVVYKLPLIGYYNCRLTAGGSPSRHGVWAAIDAHVHVRAVTAYPTPAEKAVGDAIAALLVEFAELLGVQRVIWLDQTWSSTTRKWTKYTSTFHGNHLHIELCDDASWNLTAADIEGLLDSEDDMTGAEKRLAQLQQAGDLVMQWYAVYEDATPPPDDDGFLYWRNQILAVLADTDGVRLDAVEASFITEAAKT